MGSDGEGHVLGQARGVQGAEERLLGRQHLEGSWALRPHFGEGTLTMAWQLPPHSLSAEASVPCDSP